MLHLMTMLKIITVAATMIEITKIGTSMTLIETMKMLKKVMKKIRLT